MENTSDETFNIEQSNDYIAIIFVFVLTVVFLILFWYICGGYLLYCFLCGRYGKNNEHLSIDSKSVDKTKKINSNDAKHKSLDNTNHKSLDNAKHKSLDNTKRESNTNKTTTISESSISKQTNEKSNKQLDPMYKELENSLRTLYDYPDVYVESKPKSNQHIPYFGPQTRSNEDVPEFLTFARKVINDYPQHTRLHKYDSDGISSTGVFEEFVHPIILIIRRKDINNINKKAKIKVKMDPRYKTLENSLKYVYDYPDVYVEEHTKSGWYVPYICPKTRSEADVPQFIEFAHKVMAEYPKSGMHKVGSSAFYDFKDDEPITHPVALKIWLKDTEQINSRAKANEKYDTTKVYIDPKTNIF